MKLSPDQTIFWQHGFITINLTIVTTWAIMLVLVIFARLITRKLKTDITISIQLKKTDELSVEVFDITGKKVYSKVETVVAGNSTRTISTEHLAKGEYFIKIRGGEISFSQKIVKQ